MRWNSRNLHATMYTINPRDSNSGLGYVHLCVFCEANSVQATGKQTRRRLFFCNCKFHIRFIPSVAVHKCAAHMFKVKLFLSLIRWINNRTVCIFITFSRFSEEKLNKNALQLSFGCGAIKSLKIIPFAVGLSWRMKYHWP